MRDAGSKVVDIEGLDQVVTYTARRYAHDRSDRRDQFVGIRGIDHSSQTSVEEGIT